MPDPEVESFREKYDTVKIVLTVLLIASSLLNGYSYFKIMELNQLHGSYLALYNRTVTVEGYYNESRAMYSELRGEYEYLSSSYGELLRRHTELVKTMDDMLSYNLSMQLEKGKSLTLPLKSNATFTYQVPFSGYIEVTFSATQDIYVWVGSSAVDGVYYSRYPPFPQTSLGSTFKVPVMPDVYINFGNPNEFTDVRVTFSIRFVY